MQVTDAREEVDLEWDALQSLVAAGIVRHPGCDAREHQPSDDEPAADGPRLRLEFNGGSRHGFTRIGGGSLYHRSGPLERRKGSILAFVASRPRDGHVRNDHRFPAD